MEKLPLSCQCGQVTGHVDVPDPALMPRYVCYCDDCQAFIRHLNQTDTALDPHGGTEVVHTPPARLTITSGADQLRCVALSEKGAYRWYTGCCRTPIGSIPPSIQFPFVSLITAFIKPGAEKDRIGPLHGRLRLHAAHGDVSGLSHEAFPVRRVIGRIIRSFLWERIRGRHRPTPFFEGKPAKTVSPVHVLSAEERQAAYTTSTAPAVRAEDQK